MDRRTFNKLALAATSMLVAGNGFAQSLPQLTEPVEITFYNYNLASAGMGQDATNKMIREFMELNPNIKVKGVAVPSAEMASRVQADAVAGRTPDVAQIVFKDLDYVARNLGAKALED